MSELQTSLIVEAMVPRWDLREKGYDVEIVTRPAFAYVLKTAMELDDYGSIGRSTFCTDDYRAIDVLYVHTVSPSQREEWLEHRRLMREDRRTDAELHADDMTRADRLWRKAARGILSGVGLKIPHFLETNWGVYSRIQAERYRRQTWYQRDGSVLLHNSPERQVAFVALDSEQRFRAGESPARSS